MLDRWIKSVFIKRAALAMAAAAGAEWLSHASTVISHLQLWGITATIHVNQEVLADHLTVVMVGLSQGLHEIIAARYPTLSQWI